MENSIRNTDYNITPPINQHLSITYSLSKKQLGQLSTNCAKNSITPYELGHKYIGSVHVIQSKFDVTQSGTNIVKGVSHTLTYCSFGTIALGIGIRQVAQVFNC